MTQPQFGPQVPLFEIEERRLLRGERVVVHTMWGDQFGTLMAISHDRRQPLAEVEMDDSGETISIDPARVALRECGDDECYCGGCVL